MVDSSSTPSHLLPENTAGGGRGLFGLKSSRLEISAGTIIYVGKALNLKNRARSYSHPLLLQGVLRTVAGRSLINL
jgi:hypothetical protein